ncbi:hypothetical protein EW146_g878 [Bondarzewia mesenterica]|uniref:Ubiquinol-cytochrome c chaperone domain-containing protein n=1 Tax=Bondarzewia mesenterica TaxID=1095465 RepID=A0A4V3XG93_9AGAM|nr:hypothetical protein EW146_g878 [Bondarzewia mesenterica]
MFKSRIAFTSRPLIPPNVFPRRALSVPPLTTGPSQPYRHEKPLAPPQSWFTRQLKKSPTAMRIFLKVFGSLGYASSKQVSARRALVLYKELCAGRAEEEESFWRDECCLPSTFQSWFTITNLHVWILTTRLRALPSPKGQEHIQGLIDHFFLDVEERIREVLQPQPQSSLPSPLTDQNTQSTSSGYYTGANRSHQPPRRRGRAPEALVTKQMKIFREQWAGLSMACDLALVRGDAELAGAIWRNLLGARGAQGIAYPTVSSSSSSSEPAFRRSINPGGEIEKYSKYAPSKIQQLETRDDGSGVHDFTPNEADRYLKYPGTMVQLVAYMRREVNRLARFSDEEFMAGNSGEIGREGEGVEKLKFKKVVDGKGASV